MTSLIEQPTPPSRVAPGAPPRATEAPNTPTASGTPRTPRDTSIDVARAWCLAVVVWLHALMVGVSVVGGSARVENAMDGWAGFAALSWFVQVMPLFFVLGGFSSATQWARLREAKVRPHDYAVMRMRRLVPPALSAMGVTAVALLAMALSGMPGEIVAVAGFRLSQVLWFLGVYLLCTMLVPVMAAAHRARPRLTLAVLVLLVVAVDALRLGTGVDAIGFANLLFVWVLMQQLGFFLAEGRIPRTRGSLLLGAACALGALVALCLNGVYSADLYENLNPPTVALVLLGVAQLCLFQLARPALRRASGVRPVAAVVAAINARAMTIYSWHMPVLIGLAALLLVTVGDALPAPLTATWWFARPLWFVVITVATAVVVAVAGRREAAAARIRGCAVPAVPAVRGIASYLLAAAGVVLVLLFGASPAAWLAGTLMLLTAQWATRERRVPAARS